MDLKEKQIIYVDNKPHIKCGVVILPTTDKSASLSINQGYLVREFYNSVSKALQHLYITSDEEIKKGDWCYKEDVKNKIFKWVNTENDWYNDSKKIIATTDKSLSINMYDINGAREVNFDIELPQPSQQFIEKYIEEYNKGNKIIEVLVEVEEYDHDEEWSDIGGAYETYKLRLKIDSQNQITIRKQKNSWSREEVMKLIEDFTMVTYNIPLNKHPEREIAINKWIEENL